MFTGQKGEENLEIKYGLLYGYSLQLTEELRIDLSSQVGYHNFFQLLIRTPKFSAHFPIINPAFTNYKN